MNAGRREEIEMVAQSLQMSGEFVPAPMLRELLADVDALTQERDALARMLDAEMLRRQDAESDILRLTEDDTQSAFERTAALRAERDALAAENANAKAALITAAQLMREANARANALAAELARVRGELAAVPVREIRKVCNAAEMDGYTNGDVEEWLSELELHPQA